MTSPREDVSCTQRSRGSHGVAANGRVGTRMAFGCGELLHAMNALASARHGISGG